MKHLASVLMDGVKREVTRIGVMNTLTVQIRKHKTESEEDSSLGMKAGLLLIKPKLNFP